ncbi:MAG: response regulator receiver protein [Verrucomicrobiales bacterium]|nr:response regulator receiver protein [Verrucomicrobiales bacterium]
MGSRRLGVVNPIHKVTDGHEAIRYPNGDALYGDRCVHPFPAVIFLDLKLPMVSGAEVLEWLNGVALKGDSHIFIYSEIKNVSDVREVYSLGADSFLSKPVNEVDLMNLIYHFPKHWDMPESQMKI